MKRFLTILLMALSVSTFIHPLWAQKGRILMIIAPEGFRDEELRVPKAFFEGRGFQVTIASATKGEARGMFGMRVKPDIELKEADVTRYDAVVFVGGVGAQRYFSNPEALRIAREAAQAGKVLGAICLAPGILARAGVLKGKRATVWASEGKTLKAMGAKYTGRPVEVDGLIVTANGPQAAEVFARQILELLAK
ncbi:MAG TPA: DJ-1/PfpI family protein [Deltaproteobacteria bacterium]|nr:DJ-1/PfpI family protein [Deltaproteobacteria bacterium]